MSNRHVIRWYNDSDVVPGLLDTRLTTDGIGYVDYGTGKSFKSSDVTEPDRTSAAGQAFNALEAISERGGIGTMRPGGGDLITVGEWQPNCLGFHTVPDGPTLKTAQMSVYGVVEPSDDVHDTLDALFDNGSLTIRHSVDPSPIESAMEVLEEEGRLRTPTWSR